MELRTRHIILLFLSMLLFSFYRILFDIRTFLPRSHLPVQLRKDVAYVKEDIQILSTDIRILCLVITSPKYHLVRAVHVAATWGRHCSKTVFVSSEPDDNLPEIFVADVGDSYYDLWGKVSKGNHFLTVRQI